MAIIVIEIVNAIKYSDTFRIEILGDMLLFGEEIIPEYFEDKVLQANGE